MRPAGPTSSLRSAWRSCSVQLRARLPGGQPRAGGRVFTRPLPRTTRGGPAWERRLAACLRLADEAGELAAGADCDQLSAFFWIGWEGAVLRARLVRSTRPLDVSIAGFLARAASD
ncbi:TetR family transcriptional regulator C-terminal domain-containing protein [Amycolatopsis tucumanensis]|uniref:TetR family transcriptional regulator C-terminal domain-containing protein n=1 Tax=Amycolatopsis tucumanensis TaxID=401106 RepID=UPI0035583541